MLYISRNDIEQIAEYIIEKYKKAFVPKHHLCYNIDPVELANLLGFRIVYANITADGSILGQTSCSCVWTPIVGPDGDEYLFYLDGKTILVEERLLRDSKNVGRKNFTIAHELAHQIINREYQNMYSTPNQVFCDYRRSAKPHKEITDWYEWQADALAAAILLPKDALTDAMFMFGLGDKIKLLSKRYSENRYNQFCEMAEFFQVSKTALSYRMEQLGLLERNYLVLEAQQKKGDAKPCQQNKKVPQKQQCAAQHATRFLHLN